ncbi:uncharacterized protein LOC118424080 isoform X3 [Branchiostoma floridae]|uniref:Uncharacterized protein LOC118424080 isoform X3 n=1 Tax=Branchiostoma floridae TaxID=7739 RepID=A0A9J7N0R2_BRAFL|nr:uncharacterized protein LOC118424080 isoform X3 [Branchiostoma floridae]
MLSAVLVSVVLALTVPSTHGFVLGWGRCPYLPPAKDFSVADWTSGEWLETYRFPFLLTRDVTCGRASYSPEQPGQFKFTYKGQRNGVPIETVDFLYLQQLSSEASDLEVYHEDFSYLPRLSYRIVEWKPTDSTSGGYFVHFGCKDVLGIFNLQNLSIYQRQVDFSQLQEILQSLEDKAIHTINGNSIIAMHPDCPLPEGSGYEEP